MVAHPKEVFFSHSSLDLVFADKLAAVMRSHGIPVWYSRTNIIGAQQWHDEIGAALQRCDWLALILSPESVGSVWVKRELLFSLNEDRYAGRIVPILYHPCDYLSLSWTLGALQMIDFTGTFEDGCRALLRIWGIGYRD
jgi:TIR domain